MKGCARDFVGGTIARLVVQGSIRKQVEHAVRSRSVSSTPVASVITPAPSFLPAFLQGRTVMWKCEPDGPPVPQLAFGRGVSSQQR